MKNRFYTLTIALMLYILVGGACTKDNAQPVTPKNQTVSNSSQQSPTEATPASDAPSTGGCPHSHK
jgi:hypothetical protein